MNIPKELIEKFQHWNQARKNCPLLGNYCLLTGAPCAYIHCLFRSDPIVLSSIEISCPKCQSKIKYPSEQKCSKCGYSFVDGESENVVRAVSAGVEPPTPQPDHQGGGTS
jgi:hypothetical protein